MTRRWSDIGTFVPAVRMKREDRYDYKYVGTITPRLRMTARNMMTDYHKFMYGGCPRKHLPSCHNHSNNVIIICTERCQRLAGSTVAGDQSASLYLSAPLPARVVLHESRHQKE